MKERAHRPGLCRRRNTKLAVASIPEAITSLGRRLELNERGESAQVLERLMKKQTVEFSSHTANLALMRNCVRKFLNGYPFSERERLLMVLGVDEACTNVIRYAYRLRNDQLISLHMEGLRKCVRVRLRDYGEQVLPNQMKGRSHDMIKPGGLGLFLIRNAFDEVDYIHKRRGTELVLTKNLANQLRGCSHCG
jgi:anti-sigma regulatory factor (Ser/Thr protein kinase)